MLHVKATDKQHLYSIVFSEKQLKNSVKLLPILLCHDLHNSKVGRKNSDHNKLKIDLKIIIHSVWKWPEKNLGQFARACCYLLFNSNLKFKIFLRQNTRHIINLITRSQKSWENSKKIYWDSCERFKKKLTCFSKAIETLFVQPSFVEALVVVLKQSVKSWRK